MSRILLLNIFLFLGALVYPIFASFSFFVEGPGPDPIADWMAGTGSLALLYLFLSLGIRPVAFFFSGGIVREFRRTTGLISFGYAFAHAFVFFYLDYGLDLDALRDGIIEKPFAIVGFLAFSILFLLAATSTKFWMRRLGRNWKRLHSGVYVAAFLVVLHFFWLVKSDYREPAAWGFLLLLLLVLRFSGPMLSRRRKGS